MNPCVRSGTSFRDFGLSLRCLGWTLGHGADGPEEAAGAGAAKPIRVAPWRLVWKVGITTTPSSVTCGSIMGTVDFSGDFDEDLVGSIMGTYEGAPPVVIFFHQMAKGQLTNTDVWPASQYSSAGVGQSIENDGDSNGFSGDWIFVSMMGLLLLSTLR